jgi:Zn finger protein HypA/HybF involved in hydrogenase expression
MAERTCKKCGRPLTEEESGEYCPNCEAKRAGCIGKIGAIISAIGATVVAVAGVVIAVIGLLGKNKKQG